MDALRRESPEVRMWQWTTPCGKLNPLWVSQLMGVPVGWCDPEWTSCDSSATVAYPPK